MDLEDYPANRAAQIIRTSYSFFSTHDKWLASCYRVVYFCLLDLCSITRKPRESDFNRSSDNQLSGEWVWLWFAAPFWVCESSACLQVRHRSELGWLTQSSAWVSSVCTSASVLCEAGRMQCFCLTTWHCFLAIVLLKWRSIRSLMLFLVLFFCNSFSCLWISHPANFGASRRSLKLIKSVWS